MKVARLIAYLGLVFGALRLAEYYFFGDLHRGYALAWAIHALASGIAILWLTRKDSYRQKAG